MALTVIIGTMAQRICGMGLGLIAVPVFVFVTGPVLGVLTINAAAFVAGLAIAWSLRVDILWHRWRVIAAWAIVGTIPGWALVTWLPRSVLELTIGVGLVASLAASLLMASHLPRIPKQALGACGFIGAILNTTVGQAAPIMVAYQRATRWDQRTFQATLQPSFLVMNAASVLAKGVGIDIAAPPLGYGVYIATVGTGVLVGIIAGELAAAHVSISLARTLALTVACVGAVATCVHGIVGIV
nr:sulfite exporter TauE/SafE family protein [Nanchangia anserum]